MIKIKIVEFLILTIFLAGRNCQQADFDELMKYIKYPSFDRVTTESPDLYDFNDDVIELTSFNFDDLVCHHKELWVVQFYSKTCAWSKRYAAEYKRLASAAKSGEIKVGAVQCLGSENFCNPFTTTEINRTRIMISYPEIYFFYGEDRQKYSYEKESDRNAETIMEKLEEFYHEEKNYEKKIKIVGFSLVIVTLIGFLIYVARRKTIQKDIESEILMQDGDLLEAAF